MKGLKLSICVVALNEEESLPLLFKDLKKQRYPHELIEIVLVDSCSTDKTKSIMEQFSKENNGFYSIQVLDNPKNIQSSGWNIAIRNATGDVISRIDAHSMVPPDFSVLVMKDIEAGEDVVGGIRPCIINKNDKWGQVLLATENSLFGSSISIFKHSREKQYVKTVFHASYRREVFEKSGLFNEYLLRTEDNELHYRIRKNGYKICYDPQIVTYQYARNNLTKMINQKYNNGYWIGLTTYICPRCLSLYHYVPMLFIAGIISTTILSLFGFYQLGFFMWGAYLILGLSNTFIAILNNGFNGYYLLMPILFLILHISYGIGTIKGLVDIGKAREINRWSMNRN